MKLKSIFIALLCIAPIFAMAQINDVLIHDLEKITTNLNEEQLARLINYAVKLQDEPIEKNQKKQKLQKKGANVVWETKKYTLDHITKGDILFLPFKHTNFSDTPYMIKSIQSNCNCVTAQTPTDPLQENESRTLLLSIDTRQLGNAKDANILIYDNSSTTGKTYLLVQADLIEPATANH